MTSDLRYTLEAEQDLDEIGNWVAARAGLETALAYVARIETACGALLDFLRRGTPRSPDATIRSVPFERRATILYQVECGRVIILGIYHAGRDIALE